MRFQHTSFSRVLESAKTPRIFTQIRLFTGPIKHIIDEEVRTILEE